MRTRTAPAGHPREDRLERLLRTGGELPAVIDPPDDEGLPEEGWGDVGRGRDVGGADDRADLATLTDDQDDRLARGRHRAAQVSLLSVPESLRSAELHVGVRAVRGLLVLVVVAVLVLGGRWLWTQRVAAASPPDRVITSQAGTEGGSDGHAHAAPGGKEAAGSQAGTAASADAAETAPGQGDSAEHEDGAPADVGTGSGGAGSGESTASSDLVVHVAGAVVGPGVVSVPAGSRVVDAVRAAGGLTDEADESTLNLARPLVDGERVWVGRPGEAPPVAPGPLPGASGGSGGEGGAGGGQPVPLDLNAATQADLEELPGVGPVTAGHILGWREEHGRFSSVDELLEVSGIGERTLAQLEPLVTVGG